MEKKKENFWECSPSSTDSLLVALVHSYTELLFQISNEGFSFPVSRAIANMSQVVRTELLRADMVEHDDDSPTSTLDIPLPKVDVAVLKKVIEFCDHYLTEPMTEIERPLKSTTNMEEFVQKWYADFADAVEQDLLFGLIVAAGSMEIKPLLDLTCLALHNRMILGKISEEIRAILNRTTHQEDG
jgi:S-phase kinase-associated protein 1